MDLLDQQTADRVVRAMGDTGIGCAQLVARTGLNALALMAKLCAYVPFTAIELILIACALDRDPGDLIPGGPGPSGRAPEAAGSAAGKLALPEAIRLEVA